MGLFHQARSRMMCVGSGLLWWKSGKGMEGYMQTQARGFRGGCSGGVVAALLQSSCSVEMSPCSPR